MGYFAIVDILIKVEIFRVLALVILPSTVDSDKDRPGNRADEGKNAYNSIEGSSAAGRRDIIELLKADPDGG